MSEPNGNNWMSPGLLLGIVGMLGSVGGAWAMFEGRISRVEQSYQFSDSRLNRIESKLDRLIENESRRP